MHIDSMSSVLQVVDAGVPEVVREGHGSVRRQRDVVLTERTGFLGTQGHRLVISDRVGDLDVAEERYRVG